MPYQARHSGPSIDAARHLRTRAEIRARGRWASEKSVARYERPARLAESFQELPTGVQEFCQRAEEHFSALIVWRVTPGLLATPARCAGGPTSRTYSAGLAGSARPRGGLG